MTQETTSLVVDMRPGDRLLLETGVSVELVQKSGRSARLRVLAPREVQIQKKLADTIESRGKHGKLNTG
jgi:sRNA-binding carbon storage regulator CsrA